MAAFASSVMLGDLNDFITPAQSCVNPIFAEAANATPDEKAIADAADAEAAEKGTGPKIQLSFDNTAIFRHEDSTTPTTASVSAPAPAVESSSVNSNPFAAKDGLLAPNLIKATGDTKTAKVSLSDCLACSGCVTSAETVLIQQQSVEQVKVALASGEHDLFVASVSSAARTALAVNRGWEINDVLPKLRELLAARGVHYVLDSQLGSNLALLEIRKELDFRMNATSTAVANKKRSNMWVRPAATIALNEDEDQTMPPSSSGEVSRLVQVVHGGGNTNVEGEENLEETEKGRVPLLTSSCPGWICFVEKTHPEVIPYLSTVKSPQQVMGSLVKACAARSGSEITPQEQQPEVQIENEVSTSRDQVTVESSSVVNMDTEAEQSSTLDKAAPPSSSGGPRVYHLTIMPCPDKKLEASRKDFEAKLDGGSADVDCVLTTNELLSWLEDTEMDATEATVASTKTTAAVTVTANSTVTENASTTISSAVQRLSALDEWLSHSPPHAPSKHRSGASGLLEYMFRSLARDRFGVTLEEDSPLPYKQVRNRDFQTVALAVDGKTVLNCAAVYGFRNIQSIIRQLKKGKCPYDFVEVMACPGGCLNGGGQPAAPIESTDEDGVEVGAVATQRAKDAYLLDVVKKHEGLLVKAPENDEVAERVNKEWLEGGAESEKLRGKVLHTRYHAVPKMEGGLGQSW